MRLFIHSAVVASAIAAIACGATTSSNPPVYPPSRSEPTMTAPSGPTEANPSAFGVIPAGQELDVRLQQTLSSGTATPEQRFEATTAVDLTQNGRVLLPAGAIVRGVVSSVDKAGRIDRTGRLTLAFDGIVINGREYPMRATATQVFESKGIRGEAGTAGIGGGAGAIIGGIIGGVKGAIIGAVVGAGGAIAATEGKDVTLPQGSFVRLRIDQPITVR